MDIAQDFEEYVAIVDAGSVSAAARELRVPRPTLARRLGRLEARLGVRLMHRSTRRMVLTKQGEELYVRARRIVADAREAEAAVRRVDGRPRGLLRVSVPLIDNAHLAGRFFFDFMARYPDVELEIVSVARHVDLVGEGIDVALRGGTIVDPSLIVRRLGSSRLVAVASPGYLSARGTPQDASDLAHHSCIVGYQSGLRPERQWPLLDGGHVKISGQLISNDMPLRRMGAIAGVGIALVVESMVHADLTEGRLVHVLSDQVGLAASIGLVYPAREFVPPQVRAFVDHVLEVVRSDPEWIHSTTRG